MLMALGATLTVIGPKGERKLAVEDLFAGYYETVLEKDELIAEVHVPRRARRRPPTSRSPPARPTTGRRSASPP